MAKVTSKKTKNCNRGFTCGRSCISKAKICRSNIGADGKKLAESYADFVKRIAAEEAEKQSQGSAAAGGGGGGLDVLDSLFSQDEIDDLGLDGFDFGTEKEDTETVDATPGRPPSAEDIEKLSTEGQGKLKFAVDSGIDTKPIAEELGYGQFGVAVRNQDNTVSKYGNIPENEIRNLEIASAANVGPELIGSQIKGNQGRIDMEDLTASGYKPLKLDGTPNPSTIEKIYAQYENLMAAGLLHSDTHGGNIMQNEQGDIKFIDFGTSRLIGEDSVLDSRMLRGDLELMFFSNLTTIDTLQQANIPEDFKELSTKLIQKRVERLPFDHPVNQEIEDLAQQILARVSQ